MNSRQWSSNSRPTNRPSSSWPTVTCGSVKTASTSVRGSSLCRPRRRAFLAASCGTVRFAGRCRKEVYAWTERTLVRHQYASLSRPEKGLIRRYVASITGLSRAQVARLIGQYAARGRVSVTAYQRRKFAARYTKADVDLLAYVDQSHGNLSGPATKHILQREYEQNLREQTLPLGGERDGGPGRGPRADTSTEVVAPQEQEAER